MENYAIELMKPLRFIADIFVFSTVTMSTLWPNNAANCLIKFRISFLFMFFFLIEWMHVALSIYQVKVNVRFWW